MAKYLSIKAYCSLLTVCLVLFFSAYLKGYIPDAYFPTFSNSQLTRADAKQLLERYEHFARISETGCKMLIVDVNGISAGKETKEVKFTWTLSGPSEEAVLRCYGTGAIAGQPHKAVAMIQLYDNGWQVEYTNQR